MIKTEAKRLGFILTGITHPGGLPHLGQYQAWLDAGHHAGMLYLATERARIYRSNIDLVLPGCKSILALGIRYADPQSITPPPDNSLHGRIAAYAWGKDYHTEITTRLDALGAFIQTFHPDKVAYKGYTDTGPILEREIAQRAGLGWIGKNTCLINPRIGSYFFLAELFLSIELETDLPFSFDRCGNCTRCIQACPTGCILHDRTLDANRCISYLTIENKSEIPPDLQGKLGNWVFGCDICQTVCPWNRRFSTLHGDAAFEPRSERAAFPELRQELQLTPDEFKSKYNGSALLRTRWRGYQRNLWVALKNATLIK